MISFLTNAKSTKIPLSNTPLPPIKKKQKTKNIPNRQTPPPPKKKQEAHGSHYLPEEQQFLVSYYFKICNY